MRRFSNAAADQERLVEVEAELKVQKNSDTEIKINLLIDLLMHYT